MDMLHVVYLANWFMGGPPLAVSAWVDKRLEGDGDVEDIALVRYVYANGQALVNMAWGVGPGGVEIGGTRGRVVMTNTDFGTHPFVPAAGWTSLRSRAAGRGRPAIPSPTAWPVSPLISAMRWQPTPSRSASGERGLRVLDAVLGAYVSAALVAEIALPLPSDHPVYMKGSAGIADLDLPDASPVLRRGLFGVKQAPA